MILAGMAALAAGLSGCGGGGGGNDGILSFYSLTFTGSEATGTAELTLQRLGGEGAVGATIVFSSGTAIAGVDFDDTPIGVTWDAGDVSPKTVTVTILDDNSDETNPTFKATLTNPTGGATIRVPLNETTVTILDDDVGGSLVFSAPSYTFNEDGTLLGSQVTVNRINGSDGFVTAHVGSADQTANGDPMSPLEAQDYFPVSIEVSFADGDTTPVTIPLPATVIQDALPEIDETFQLVLSNPVGAQIGFIPAAAVTIVDDDFVLEVPAPPEALRFGASLARLGRYLLIGAPDAAAQNGRVYVIDPSNGMLVDTIARPGASQLGSTMAIDGEALMVGAQGAVWVLNAATRTDRFTLTSSLAGFGSALSGLADGRLTVGAPLADIGGSLAGWVGIYDAITGAELQNIGGTAGQKLGTALALAGSDLVAGAPGGPGAVLRYAGTPLALAATLDNPMPQAPSSGFGAALAASGLSVFIGEPDFDFGGLDSGQVHWITPDAATSFPLGIGGARFGARLLVVGDKLCIQAPGDGPAGSGRVHVFDLFLNPNFNPVDDPTPSAGADFGGAMCDFDGALAVGAPLQDAGGTTDRGAVWIFRLF